MLRGVYMAISNLWGWGVVRFVYETTTLVFEQSFGSLRFEHIKKRNVTIDNRIIDHSVGFRPMLELQLLNYEDDDADKFALLMGILSASLNDGLPITISHAYETGDTGSQLSYSYFLDSDIAPSEIAQNVSVGQTLGLSFIGEQIVNTLPDNLSAEPQRNRCSDSTDITTLRAYDSEDDDAIRSIN